MQNNYGSPKYWDTRYRKEHGTTFDWLEDWQDIKYLIQNQTIEGLTNITSTNTKTHKQIALNIK